MSIQKRLKELAPVSLLCLVLPFGLAACGTARTAGLEVNVNDPRSGLTRDPTFRRGSGYLQQDPNVTVLQCIEGAQRLYSGTQPVDVAGWYVVVDGQTVWQCPRPETAVRMAFLNQNNVVIAVCDYFRVANRAVVAIGSSACQFGQPRRRW